MHLRKNLAFAEIVTPNLDERCSLRLPPHDLQNFLGVRGIQNMKEKSGANRISHSVGIDCRLKEESQEPSVQHESSLHDNDVQQTDPSKDISLNEQSSPRNPLLSENQPVPKYRQTDRINHSSDEKYHAKFQPTERRGKQEKSCRKRLHQDSELKVLKPASPLSALEEMDNAGLASNHAEAEIDENDRPVQSKLRRRSSDLAEISLFVKWLISSKNLSHILDDGKYPDLLSSFINSTKRCITSLKNPSSLCQHIRRILQKRIFLDSPSYSLDTDEIKMLRDFFSTLSCSGHE